MMQLSKCDLLIKLSWLLLFCKVKPINCWTGRIVFSDEFDGNQINTTKWRIENNCLVPNNQLHCYTNRSENVRLQNGSLVIEARNEKYGAKNYTSGQLRQVSGLTAFGAYVFRAKFPKAAFLWSALWTQSSMSCKYNEVNVVEHRGQVANQLMFSAHFGRNWSRIKSNGSSKLFSKVDFSSDFHEFAILWSELSLIWFVDNEKVFEVSTREADWIRRNNKPCSSNQKPFDEITSIIMNVAVGGSHFPIHNYGYLTSKIIRNWLSPKLEVDWIRIYQT